MLKARREADRKRRQVDAKAAAERQAAEERTKEQQRMAAVREERERQAVATRLSDEIREQWLVLLEAACVANTTSVAGVSYGDFSLGLETISKQIQSIRVKYAHRLQMGYHKTLGMAVYATCAALATAKSDWQIEQQPAYDVAERQAAVQRYRSISNPSLLDRANTGESMGQALSKSTSKRRPTRRQAGVDCSPNVRSRQNRACGT